MLHHVALVRSDVSEELSAFFIKVTRIGELGTTLTVTSNRRTLRRNTSFGDIKPSSYVAEFELTEGNACCLFNDVLRA
jgi:hypothetical protein